MQAAQSFGVPGYVVRYDSFAPVEEHVTAGRPVVLSIRFGEGELDGAPIDSTRGHLLVVVGFDGDEVIVNDPAARAAAGVRRRYRRDQLASAWLDHSAVAYVFGE